MLLRLSRFLLLLCSIAAFSQENYTTASIPTELLDNANAVLRHSREDIVIASRNSIKVTEHRVVTIYNESGAGYMGAQAYFDKSTSVRSIEAFIYDKNGQQLRKFKRRDFKDVSVSSDADITDNRMLYLDYTPVAYPFTVVFNCETESQNTAFIPMWTPIEGSFISTQLSERTITADPSLGFRYKDFNFSDVVLNKQQQGNVYSFKSENIPAVRNEDEAPSFSTIRPFVLFSLEKFHLEGVNGEAPNWAAMGRWMYTSLINGTEELPQETIDKIKALTANETDPLKKARIVYKYVQGKTRYVSIQLGIGGWKPMLAKDVDRLGYGDCKALSNYTRALLKVIGIESYCTVLYSGSNTRNLQKEFVSMQGNHMILAIPHNGTYVWLECTSQVDPFGHQGNFTDNRFALVIKPEGGELVRTHDYLPTDNTQLSVSDLSISPEGMLTGSVKRISAGLQYDDRLYLTRLSADELSKRYKKRFSHLNGLSLKKTNLKNDSDNIQLTEELTVEVPSYGSNSGGRLIFAINAFNQVSYVPVRYRNRKMPLEVDYGYTDQDEITINLPEGYAVEAIPENVEFTEKFGEYKAEYTLADKNRLLLKRTIKLNEGLYPKEDYEKYREFRDKIARSENAKAVLVKK
jgi:hypothetical protein